MLCKDGPIELHLLLKKGSTEYCVLREASPCKVGASCESDLAEVHIPAERCFIKAAVCQKLPTLEVERGEYKAIKMRCLSPAASSPLELRPEQFK